MEAHVLLKALSLGLFYTYEDSSYLGILIIWQGLDFSWGMGTSFQLGAYILIWRRLFLCVWQGLDFSWGMGTSFQLGAYILIWRRLFLCVCMYALVCFNFDEMGLGCLRCLMFLIIVWVGLVIGLFVLLDVSLFQV